MRCKFPGIFLLSAWLVATGGLWDVVQVVAWARMFSTEVATVSVFKAAEDTFSAEKKCKMCLLVEQGKRSTDETSGAFAGLAGKAPIVFQSMTRIVVSPPSGVTGRWTESKFARFRSELPAVPPPRA